MVEIRIAIQRLVIAWGCDPMRINGGDCEAFAGLIEDQGFGEAMWGDELYDYQWSGCARSWDDWVGFFAPYHCFIRFEGRYYDSECPEGVFWPDDLPFYQRDKQYLSEVE